MGLTGGDCGTSILQVDFVTIVLSLIYLGKPLLYSSGPQISFRVSISKNG